MNIKVLGKVDENRSKYGGRKSARLQLMGYIGEYICADKLLGQKCLRDIVK